MSGIFSDINTVQLMGNITADPEVRYTQSGTAVASVSIATNHSYKSGEEWKTDVEFHNLVLWGRLAEHAQTRFMKGTRVLVNGRLTTRSWEHEGKKYFKTEIVVADMILIDRYKTKDGNTVSKADNAKQVDNTDMVEQEFADLAKTAPNDTVIDPDNLPF